MPGRCSIIHDLIAGRRGVPVVGAGGLPLGRRHVARRVRAEVAVVRPAPAAPGSGVARAAAIGRDNINRLLDGVRFERAMYVVKTIVIISQGVAAAREVGHDFITRHRRANLAAQK